MDFLLGFILVSIIGTVMIVRLIFWVTNKSASAAITNHFKAAEYILEHHQPPPMWMKPKRTLTSHILNKEKVLVTQGNQAYVQHLDELLHFFEHCPFFETEDVRTALLEQLGVVRKSWEKPL